jgi:hypothetical protein
MGSPDVVLIPTVGRSGAGTLVRLVSHLGWTVPAPEVGPDLDNLFGYAESQWVLRTHREWLKRVPLYADRGRLDFLDVCRGVAGAADVSELAFHLRQVVAAQGRVVIKDPRLTWFHDVWISALAAAGLRGVTVALVRAPADVLASKARSFGVLTSDDTRLRQWLVSTLGLCGIVKRTQGAQVVDVRNVVFDQAETEEWVATILGMNKSVVGATGIDSQALSVDSPWPVGLDTELRGIAQDLYLASRTGAWDTIDACRSRARSVGL